MTKLRHYWTRFLALATILLCGSVLILGGGCDDRSSRPRISGGIAKRKTNNTAFLLEAVTDGLNNLPREVVLELTPPKPILDDVKSADGQPVLATCNVTPAVPDGPFNFFSVPRGNANFRKIGVRRGDKLRFFADYDQEGLEHGYEQVSYFEFVVRRLDQFDPDNALIVEGGLSGSWDIPTRIEVWRFSDKRMNEIDDRLKKYYVRGEPPIGWEPSADESALVQLLERANQWLRNVEAENSWQSDPRIAELPESLQETPILKTAISTANLESGTFDATEARQLQQAIWLRDISRWAKGEAVSPVDVATALFDWTIRNIQLDDPKGAPGFVHQPWQVLMYGRGTAEQRAWIFAELCRQQQLDVVMLAAGERWWLPALWDDDKLYLFDTQLGLPVPGAEPGTVATLAELVASPELLSRLSVEGESEYPTTAEDLKDIRAWIVASPLQLSKRATLLEEAFEGEDFVVLTARTIRISDALAKASNLTAIQLWPYPFESIVAEQGMPRDRRERAAVQFLVFAQRPRLWKARVLHFQGTKDVPIEDRNDPLAQPDQGHRKAIALYQDPRVRPPNSALKGLEASKRPLYELSKSNASYWLGLLSYDLGNYRVAKDWLENRTLKARPNGPWTPGGQYNLARTYEAMGELRKAIELLEQDTSPQRLGNLVRARLLSAQLDSTAEKDEE